MEFRGMDGSEPFGAWWKTSRFAGATAVGLAVVLGRAFGAQAWSRWTELDAGIQGALIGVVGSLLGALVGGFWSSRAAVRATREEWSLSTEAKRMERLEEDVDEILRHLPNVPKGEDGQLALGNDTIRMITLTDARARRAGQTHFSSLIQQWALRDSSTKTAVRLKCTIPDAAQFRQMLGAWLIHPEEFERTKPPLSKFRVSSEALAGEE